MRYIRTLLHVIAYVIYRTIELIDLWVVQPIEKAVEAWRRGDRLPMVEAVLTAMLVVVGLALVWGIGLEFLGWVVSLFAG